MFDFHQPLFDSDGEYDDDRVHSFVAGLLTEFAASPEAQSLAAPPTWLRPVVELGIVHMGVLPGEMTRDDFEEVLFEIFPHKVSAHAEVAESVIVELRAFWTFAARQFDIANATPLLTVLNATAAARLYSELSNPSNFGMAKSIFMAGSEAGFDMASEAGLAGFMAAFNGNLLAAHAFPLESGERLPLESLRPVPTAGALKKKRKEKRTQRQAKRRNRSR